MVTSRATSAADTALVSTVMEPMLSNVSTQAMRNEPRDLLSRLYREIGISAVAAALEVSDHALKATPTPKQKREHLASKAA